MPRYHEYLVPADTSLFTPLQLQPRAVLAMALSGGSRWLLDAGIGHQDMLRKHRLGVVIVGIDFSYDAPLTYFDANLIAVRTTLRVRKAGELVEQEVDYTSDGRRVARVRLVGRWLALGDEQSLAALPARLGAEALGRFAADEVESSAPARALPPLLARLEQRGRPLADWSSTTVLHRHMCEVADQWSYVELPALAGAAREELLLARMREHAALRDGLRKPLREFTSELRRPFYVFDKARIETRAIADDGELYFVHRLLGAEGGEEHAVVVERF